MVNDQEPRYRLVDADGNVVGSLFAESDGTLKLQEGTSGNDNELSLTPQGALEVEQNIALGTDMLMQTTNNQTLADDEQLTLAEGTGNSSQLIMIQDKTDGEGWIGTSAGGNVINLNQQGSDWDTADTDGNACVFFLGSDLVLKNRKGSQSEFNATVFEQGEF